MKKLISLLTLFALILLSVTEIHAQTILNKYAAVLSTANCNALVVDSANDFQEGDTVLMIQMKGAIIDTTNTAAFGNILDYNGAGNYEYNVIQSINGNVIGLKYVIVRSYSIPQGKVQLVKVPSFQDYAVNQPHTCLPWNGAKGGVFAIYVANALTLNDNIQVSDKGFRGGTNNQNPTVVGPIICTNSNYYMAPGEDSGSMKGEGIAEASLPRSYGRGKLANGGGGGNAHNAGGAGGGNGSGGGLGGNEYYGCASLSSSGIGGISLTYSNTNNKIFLGGGGGSAQANNLTVSNGGNGGGICIITAGSITGNNKIIAANGKGALQCINNGSFGSCHDGSAGGGAAGTILLNVNTVTGSLNIEAKGGKGANEAADGTYGEVGPGGGGSGGVLWVKPLAVPATIASNLVGGLNGTILYNNSSWGAQPGSPGQVLNGLILNFPIDTFTNAEVNADFSFDRVNCFSFNFTDQSTTGSGTINSWLWTFSDNTTAGQQHPSHTFPDYGTYDVTLTATNSNGCSNTITKQVSIPYVHFANAGVDISTCSNTIASLQAYGGVSYSWSPASGLNNPAISNPQAMLTTAQTYVVSVVNNFGCTDKDTVIVNIVPGPEIEISSEGSTVSCNNKSVQLFASGADAYVWSPGAYCDDSTSASPKVNPSETTTFTVTGTNANGCTSTDTITIAQYFGNSRIFMPNAFSPNADGVNDDIKPVILCDFKLQLFAVYNRWGQRVFSTNVPDKGWDGFFDDKSSDSGVYYYYISGKKNDGDTVEMKGDISLIR